VRFHIYTEIYGEIVVAAVPEPVLLMDVDAVIPVVAVPVV